MQSAGESLTLSFKKCSFVSLDQIEGKVPFRPALPSRSRACRLLSVDHEAGSSPVTEELATLNSSRLVSMLQLLGRVP
jgi:hypothetical protein